jgi:hypothetical protein
MSCDWDIYCRTCEDNHGFSDANFQEDLMWLLIANYKEIAALDSLINNGVAEVQLKCFYGYIRPEWFVKHLGHELIPQSEYGDFGTHK